MGAKWLGVVVLHTVGAQAGASTIRIKVCFLLAAGLHAPCYSCREKAVAMYSGFHGSHISKAGRNRVLHHAALRRHSVKTKLPFAVLCPLAYAHVYGVHAGRKLHGTSVEDLSKRPLR